MKRFDISTVLSLVLAIILFILVWIFVLGILLGLGYLPGRSRIFAGDVMGHVRAEIAYLELEEVVEIFTRQFPFRI